ncbi:HDL466Cp [Eremothecium sinecaudum]|uniref:HDL466Cp n=1 Tax=Eremothecium sinecaudum TaxID=45286 RepID=A0A109UYR8_9SACH|nr:HDL466Cp [Eremothecium sinecaudum]AMD20278.1 HDL466Cp [Eremothecium sinecaudum]
MDSLEARLKFIEVIKTLHKTLNVSKDTSPSSVSSSAIDPVHFYLVHYEDHYEDFHRCLFEVAASMDSLDRVNVLIYWSRLISSLWPRCLKEVDGQYNIAGKVVHDLLLKDLNQIVHLVMPKGDWKALSNLQIVIDVFLHISKLTNSAEACNTAQLTYPRDKFPLDSVLTRAIEERSLDVPWRSPQPDSQDILRDTVDLLLDRRAKSLFLQDYFSRHGIVNVTASTNATTILHRMENDRERHKKSKEHLWFTERDTSMLEIAEFDALWQQNRMGMTRDDYQDVKELQHIAQESYLYQI